MVEQAQGSATMCLLEPQPRGSTKVAEAKPKSSRERMRETRAAADAQRKPEKAAGQRRAELMAEGRRMALEAVKLQIRDRGDKISLYTPAQLRAQADMMMGPWLIL